MCPDVLSPTPRPSPVPRNSAMGSVRQCAARSAAACRQGIGDDCDHPDRTAEDGRPDPRAESAGGCAGLCSLRAGQADDRCGATDRLENEAARRPG
eukprot:161566-Prymnesium_polylepis.1